MPRQLTIQIKLKSNSHIIPHTQIYFICIKSQVVRIKMIKKMGGNSELIFMSLEWEMILKKN